jgi:hypothetical protein
MKKSYSWYVSYSEVIQREFTPSTKILRTISEKNKIKNIKEKTTFLALLLDTLDRIREHEKSSLLLATSSPSLKGQ